MSGRAIKRYSTSDKQKIVIKNTLFFSSTNNKYQHQFDVLFSLLDTILSKCSSKQSEVIYYKLHDLNEKEIAKKLGKCQSTISQHSTSAGWLSIEKAVNYFENIFKMELTSPNAGRLIGIVGRFLVLALIILGEYEAVGLIIAAKSILRFNDTQKSEYVLEHYSVLV